MSAEVERQLAELETLDGSELRKRWSALTQSPVPRISPKLLRLALAWEIQARAFGGLPRQVQQRLDQLARGQTRTAIAHAGTRLVREWNGVAHIVTVGEDRVIRWNDREWRSLSEDAFPLATDKPRVWDDQ